MDHDLQHPTRAVNRECMTCGYAENLHLPTTDVLPLDDPGVRCPHCDRPDSMEWFEGHAAGGSETTLDDLSDDGPREVVTILVNVPEGSGPAVRAYCEYGTFLEGLELALDGGDPRLEVGES